MSSANPDHHRLSAVEHERIFQEEIVPDHLSHALPWQEPTIYALGGQPGAGKSMSKAAVVPFIPERRGNAATIDADLFREHNPRYPELQKVNDQTAAFYTDADARLWVAKAIDYVIEHRLNVVFDAPLANPATAEPILRRFQEAGYRIEVCFVATPAELSLLGNLQRYEQQVQDKGHGRLADRAYHDRALTGVLETAGRIDHAGLADTVHVYRRDGQRVYTNHRDTHGEWVRPAATSAAIETERARIRTPTETNAIVADLVELAGSITPGNVATLREIAASLDPLLDPSRPEPATELVDRVVSDRMVTTTVRQALTPTTDDHSETIQRLAMATARLRAMVHDLEQAQRADCELDRSELDRPIHHKQTEAPTPEP